MYRARDSRHERDVAVKVMRSATTNAAAERFAREIRVAAGLRHPNILPLFDSGTLRDGRRFSVMPVALGRPLRAMMDEGPLAVADAVRLAREVADALAFLHANGWVHRDVKPENILVESGHAVLTDFGIAAPMQAITPRSSPEQVAHLWHGGAHPGAHVTGAGFVIGTPRYMSPEALFGDAPMDARIDVYALGLVLYEMLAGDLPFQARSAAALIAERMSTPLPLIGKRRRDVSAKLDAVIACAADVRPGERYASASAFRDALAAVPIAADAGHVELTTLDQDRRTMLMAMLLLVGIGSAFGIWRWRTTVALDPQRIVVADLANQTGDASLARLGPLAGDLITAGLSQATRLDVVNAPVALGSRQRPRLARDDSSLQVDTRALVTATRAGLVVTGAYYEDRGLLQLLAEVTETRGGRVLGAIGPLPANPSAPEPGLQALADSVVAVTKRRHAPPT